MNYSKYSTQRKTHKMTGIEAGIGLLEQIFLFTSFVSQYWIGQLTVIAATMALITRKIGDWKILALPVMVGWETFGMHIPWVFYTIAAMVFVIEIMSMKAVEGALGAVRDNLGMIGDYFSNRRSYKGYGKLKKDIRRMDIQKEIDMLREKKNPETKRKNEILRNLEDRALEKSMKEKYFTKLAEEDLLKKKNKSSKPKEEYTE